MNRKKDILVWGSDVLKDIIGNTSLELKKNEYHQFFYLLELFPKPLTVKKYNLEIIRHSKNPFLGFLQTAFLIIKRKPDIIECYYTVETMNLLLFCLIRKLFFRIPLVSWCIGGEILYWESHNLWRKLAIKLLLNSSVVVLVRELYMSDYIKKYNIVKNKNKIKMIPNGVEIKDRIDYAKKKKIVLFLNSFKSWRHPELVPEIAKRVFKKNKEIIFKMVGGQNRGEIEKEIEEKIKLCGMEDSFFVYDFCENPSVFLDEASVFLLPSDLVYCNNALLEAMERECVPLVKNAPGSDLIVENNVSGYILGDKPEDYADKIIELLENPAKLKNMAERARLKVIKDFNNKDRIKEIIEIYNKL